MNINRIEHKSKIVKWVKDPATDALPTASGIDLDNFIDTLAGLAYAISTGKGVEEKYYRGTTGKDYLLDEKGWMHLHVDLDGDNDVLLLVEQRADVVVFIMLTDHTIFEERPRGSSASPWVTQVASLQQPSAIIPADPDETL